MKLDRLILLLLFFVSPLVQSNNSGEFIETYIISLPPIISSYASIIRWILFIVISLNVSICFRRIRNHISVENILFSLFFFLPMLVSILTNSDVLRYFLLFVFSFTLPLFFKTKIDKRVLNGFRYIVYFFIVLSFYSSYNLIFTGFRFQGFLSNPNMYGISACFWLVIIFLKDDNYSFIDMIFIIMLCVSVVLSGSRTSFIILLFLLFFNCIRKVEYLFLLVLLCVVLFIFIGSSIDEFPAINRILNISNSVNDSGRSIIWHNAFSYIKSNYQGYGMYAPSQLLNTGNVHNCYIRFFITIGIPITLMTVFIYLVLLFTFFVKLKEVKYFTTLVFLFGFVLANFAEDFFVGLGSSMFVYHCLAIGILSRCCEKE